LISSKQKALIHIAKAQLGMDDETYRDILRVHGGAESSKYLDDLGCERVMKQFAALGFRRKKRRKAPDLSILATEGQRKVLYHLMEDLNWTVKRLLGFVFKMAGKEHVETLTREEASKCIEGLKKMRGRSVTFQ